MLGGLSRDRHPYPIGALRRHHPRWSGVSDLGGDSDKLVTSLGMSYRISDVAQPALTLIPVSPSQTPSTDLLHSVNVCDIYIEKRGQLSVQFDARMGKCLRCPFLIECKCPQTPSPISCNSKLSPLVDSFSSSSNPSSKNLCLSSCPAVHLLVGSRARQRRRRSSMASTLSMWRLASAGRTSEQGGV